jgi:hypothetical protein
MYSQCNSVDEGELSGGGRTLRAVPLNTLDAVADPWPDGEGAISPGCPVAVGTNERGEAIHFL